MAAQTAPPQAGGALQGAGLFGKAAGPAAGPMAGFEALLAAFFGGQGAGANTDALKALKSLAGDAATSDTIKSALAQALGQTPGAKDAASADAAQPDLDAPAAEAGMDPSVAALMALLAAQSPQVQAQPQAGDQTLEGEALPDAGGPSAKAPPQGAFLTLAEAEADLQADEPATTADEPSAKDATFTPAKLNTAPAAADLAAPRPAPSAPAAPVAARPEAPPAPPVAPAADLAQAPAEVVAQPVETELAALEAPPAPAERPAPKTSRIETARKDAGPTAARAPVQAIAAGDAAQPTAAVAPIEGQAKEAEPGGAEALEAAVAKDEPAPKADTPDAPAQQAAAPLAQADASRAGGPAPTPVRGSPETVAALAAQIVKKLEGRSTRFDVELNPADLGRVDVRIEIGAHGRMTATMSFENPQAAAELRSRADELQKSLEQAGFDISGGLKFDVANDQRQASQGQPDQSASANGGQARGRAFQAALDTADDSASAALTSALAYRSRPATGVDIRI